MSPDQRLPSVTAEQLVRALKRAGWHGVNQRGSHLRLRHADYGVQLVVPMHRGDVPKGLLMALIKQAGLTQDEFRELL